MTRRHEPLRQQGRLTSAASKPTGSGTGLGLSLSYDIVTQGHGGTLTAESEDGRGAIFILTLPAVQAVGPEGGQV